jgi:DNA-directed RNA polymerase specialized sigma24 family protein
MPAHVLKLLAAAAADTPDADLLARFVAARDEGAFAELVRRHGPGVYRVCHRLVGPGAADDAFQSTFLVLACRARAVRKAASVGSWLIGVAGRVARQMRKRSARGPEAEVRWPTGADRAAGPPAPEPAS